MCLVINFHYVNSVERQYSNVGSLDPQRFRDICSELQAEYSFVDPVDLADGSLGWYRNPEKCLLTFDDGLKCHESVVVPILEEMRIPATFFVSSGPYLDNIPSGTHFVHWLREHLEDAEILAMVSELVREKTWMDYQIVAKTDQFERTYPRDTRDGKLVKYFFNHFLPPTEFKEIVMKIADLIRVPLSKICADWYGSIHWLSTLNPALFTLGNHSHDHVNLARLSWSDAESQILECDRFLKDFGAYVKTISYPFGNSVAVNNQVIAIVRNLGFKVGFTTLQNTRYEFSDSLAIGRTDISDFYKKEID